MVWVQKTWCGDQKFRRECIGCVQYSDFAGVYICSLAAFSWGHGDSKRSEIKRRSKGSEWKGGSKVMFRRTTPIS